MKPTCILTDGLVQFTQPGFLGREDVRILPYAIERNGMVYPDGEGLKTNGLPTCTGDQHQIRLLKPDVEQFTQVFQSLTGKYREVIVILTSCELSLFYACAEKASAMVRGQLGVTLIDSQTISVGLGLLVQLAADLAAHGLSTLEIERRVRKAVTQIYTIFSTACLSFLSQEGYIDEGQAAIGEMLGLIPLFSLEEGKLSPIEKARNPRGVLDFFQEFLGEFETLQHIAFLQGSVPPTHEPHPLREHAQLHFPHTPFSEHTINPPVATLLGPRTFGLVLFETD